MFFDPDSGFYLGSTSHYALHHRLQKFRHEVKRQQISNAGEMRNLLAMIDQLERDLGRSLLTLHAAVEVLVEGGLISQEQLAAKAEQLDALDDETDGMLDPALFRTEQELQYSPSAKQYLHWLEQQEAESPGDFLKRLEDE